MNTKIYKCWMVQIKLKNSRLENSAGCLRKVLPNLKTIEGIFKNI